jgi:hypothetical protein
MNNGINNHIQIIIPSHMLSNGIQIPTDNNHNNSYTWWNNLSFSPPDKYNDHYESYSMLDDDDNPSENNQMNMVINEDIDAPLNIPYPTTNRLGAKYKKIYKKENLRPSMIYKYGKCIITNVNPVECDVAHIVPSAICDRYKLWYKYYKYNTLFLCKNLHITFDKYLWTFDIYSTTQIDENWVTMDIIINKTANNDITYSINSYIEKMVKIPIKCIPFLYVNYQIFMYKNYQIKPSLAVPLTNKYYHVIFNDEIYNKLLSCPIYLLQLINENQNTSKIGYILDKKYDHSSIPIYLCLLDYHPFNSLDWRYLQDTDGINSSCEAVDLYNQICDSISDSSYSP